MRPRLFISSAGESLNLANAAQQNLQRAAEVTVWDQGVAELSLTMLESLLPVLHTCDFAVFVCSPEDMLQLRGETYSAVRDNVIFEIGLFMGVMGRERCFLLTPDDNDGSSLRIPSDLVGLTTAKYETGRSDNNLQAATGPACAQIERAIGRLGVRADRAHPVDTGNRPESETDSDDRPSPTTGSGEHWLRAFVDRNYLQAEKLLAKEIKTNSDSDKSDLNSWLGTTIYQRSPEDGNAHLERVIVDFPTSSNPYNHLGYALLRNGQIVESIDVFDRGIAVVDEPFSLVSGKVECLVLQGELERAEALLREQIHLHKDNANYFIELAELHEKSGDKEKVVDCLKIAYADNPGDEGILEKYARALSDMPDKKLALVPYGRLLGINPDSSTILTLRANIFLELKMFDLAMRDYKLANEKAEEKESWILANIGNLLAARGLFREGMDYYVRALAIDPESEYAHQRMAEALRKRNAEEEKLRSTRLEAESTLLSPSVEPENEKVD